MEALTSAIVRYQREAIEDPDSFWARAASELPWFRQWDRVFDWPDGAFRWFDGAQTNIAYNCLDHHVSSGRGDHLALIAHNELGERRTYTYAQLLELSKRLAAVLRGLGAGKGDRVLIYMPTCAEAIALMLATVRIGAIHVVVFAGFGAGALADRLRLSGARFLFTTDVTYRRGQAVPLLGIVDAAVAQCPLVEKIVTLKRRDDVSGATSPRYVAWDEFVAGARGQSNGYELMEANEPAFILPTSGTTARPKLAVHTHGPYQVYIRSMADWMFGMSPSDVWWATSDIGWIVGHSYIVYAPLLFGCTTIAFEGALDYPDAATFYRLVQQDGISGVFTSPTAVRLLMRYGVEPAQPFDLRSLQRVFCAGEVLNPPAWEWLQKDLLADRIPVIDHMWQTETSGPIIGNPYGLGLLPIKPGSAGVPLPGIEGEILTAEGQPCARDEKGIFVVKRPFPGLTASLWGEPERYLRDYWQRIPGHHVYFTADAASIDEDGYVWFSGRADEIIKIAGHRLGTIEVETAFLRHRAVAEAGVTGRPDELRGEVVAAFVVLREGHQPSEALRKELYDTVRRELGPVVVIGNLEFVKMLPKTRSGKIMRRVLKAVTLGKEPGDISTIEDEGSVEEAREAWQLMRD